MGVGTTVARWAGQVAASYNEAKWQRLRLNDPAGWGAAFGRESSSGRRVTTESALQLAAVWACVRLTAQAIASLPIGVYERASGDRVEATGTLVDVLKYRPNVDQTAFEYWESMVAWMATRGEAMSEIIVSGGQVVGLGRPVAMTPRRPDNGALVYEIVGATGSIRTLPAERVLHLKWFDIGADHGLSPVRFGADTLGAAMAAEESAAKLFSNGIQSSGLLTTESGVILKDEQRKQLGAVMERFVGSTNAHKLMILEGGLKYQALTLNPEDAQLLETRRFSVEEICRWFGVPPVVVGHAAQGQTMWGSGVEQILLAWLALGINPLARRIEARVNAQVVPFAVPRRGYYMEFNREGLLQMDSAAKAAFLSSMTQNGLMSRNEGRAKLNLPAREGGDELTAQINLAPIDRLGATQEI